MKPPSTVYKIYYSGKPCDRTIIDPANPEVTYSIVGGILRVYFYDKLTSRTKLRRGHLYGVNCSHTPPRVFRIVVPRQDPDAFLWLFGFCKSQRVYELTTFQQRCTQLEASGAKILNEFIAPRCRFAHYYLPDLGAQFVAYLDVSTPLTPAFVKEIFLSRQWQLDLPQPYAEKILRTRFALTDQDLAEISNPPSLCSPGVSYRPTSSL